MQKKVDAVLDQYLAAGLIQHSTSPWASPFVIIPKKDGPVRITVNYKRLNALVDLDGQPLPRVDGILDSLYTGKVFSIFDLNSAFHQIDCDEDTVPLTAFCTPTQLFEWLRMPQVANASPSWFVKVINRVVHGLKRVLGCLDDGTCFDEEPLGTRTEHDRVLQTAATVRPLNSLLKQGVPFKYTPGMVKVVKTLLSELARPPILVFRDWAAVEDNSRPLRLCSDACIDGFGASLEQEQLHGSVRPIVYISRATLPAERNWTVLELEAGGIVWAIKRLRGYLWSTKIIIYSDRKSLESIGKVPLDKQDLPDRRASAAAIRVAGIGVFVDCSCAAGVFAVSGALCITVFAFSTGFARDFAPHDVPFADITTDYGCQSLGLRLLQPLPLDRLIFFWNLLIRTPPTRGLVFRVSALWTGLGNNSGRASVWWLCVFCLAVLPAHPPPDLLTLRAPLRSPRGSGTVVGVDFFGPLPVTAKGNSYILLFIDRFSRRADMFAVTAAEFTAKGTAHIFVNQYMTKWGCPTTLLSDNGLHFCSKLSMATYEMMKIKKVTTSSYHPQTNGGTERVNHTMAHMLAVVVSEQQNDWDVHLPHVEFSYNNSVNQSTGLALNEIHIGRIPRLPLSVFDYPTFTVGGWAWVHNTAATIRQSVQKDTDQQVLKGKFALSWTGPCKVLAVGPASADATPDGSPLARKLLYLDLPSDLSGPAARCRVSVLCCKPCRNPYETDDLPQSLPAELLRCFLHTFGNKCPSFHVTADDVSVPIGRLEVDYISGHQLVRGRSGVLAVLYQTHWLGLITPSWERESDLDQFRRHILLYWSREVCQSKQGMANVKECGC
ncbi:unnamed protein product [Ectocarpus sp. CCAP 1310/34]|nr:unnamed protein product [Ectocarpus sp. CCAP 1310/34]